MIKNKFLAIATTFLLVLNTIAQVKTVAFKEFDGEEFLSNSISLGKEGVVMFGWQEKTMFALKHLDTNLQQKKQWTISTDKRTTKTDIEWHEEKGMLLILFNLGKNKYRLVNVDPDNAKYKSFEFEFPKKTYLLSGMRIVGDEIWFNTRAKGGYFIYRVGIKSGKLSVLDPAFGEDKSKPVITGLTVLTNNEVSIIHTYGSKKKRQLDVKIVDEKGKSVIGSLLASVGEEKRNSLLDATVTRIGKSDYAITGTFRKNSKKKIFGNGVYFARYTDNSCKYLSYFDYSDFEHFFDYQGEKRTEKMEQRIEKKKSKGKDVTINTLSVEHSAKILSGGLVFVAEYFYPTYRYETQTTMVNGRMQTTQRRVFDGYQYTHAMAIGINNEGEKLWDQHIPLFAPYKPFSPVRFLKIISDSAKSITALHTTGRAVHSSVIRNGEITNNKWAVTHTIPEGQREKWTSSASMWWYGKTFFILETQKTKEKGLLGKRQIKYYGAGVRVD